MDERIESFRLARRCTAFRRLSRTRQIQWWRKAARNNSDSHTTLIWRLEWVIWSELSNPMKWLQENEGTAAHPEWKLCPQQNNTFKLRRDRTKQLIVQLKQVGSMPYSVIGEKACKQESFDILDRNRKELNRAKKNIQENDYFLHKSMC